MIVQFRPMNSFRVINRSQQVPNLRRNLVAPFSKSILHFEIDRRCINGFGGPTPGQVGPQGHEAEEPQGSKGTSSSPKWGPTMFKMFESAATTFASILVLG